MSERDDWMTGEHVNAALEGIRENPVAQAYERASRRDVYGNEYEAFYHLIDVENPGQHDRTAGVTTAWCLDEACRRDDGAGVEDWNVTLPRYEDARLAGLRHCREVHTRGRRGA